MSKIKKITIKMLKDATGTQDGFTSELFKKGETYDVLPSLAASFCKMLVAEKCGKIAATLHNPVAVKKVVAPVAVKKTKKGSE